MTAFYGPAYDTSTLQQKEQLAASPGKRRFETAKTSGASDHRVSIQQKKGRTTRAFAGGTRPMTSEDVAGQESNESTLLRTRSQEEQDEPLTASKSPSQLLREYKSRKDESINHPMYEVSTTKRLMDHKELMKAQ